MIPPIRPTMMNIVFSAFSGCSKGEKIRNKEAKLPWKRGDSFLSILGPSLTVLLWNSFAA